MIHLDRFKLRLTNIVDRLDRSSESQYLVGLQRNLFVCGISLTSGQLVRELFPDCTRSCFSQVASTFHSLQRDSDVSLQIDDEIYVRPFEVSLAQGARPKVSNPSFLVSSGSAMVTNTPATLFVCLFVCLFVGLV